MSGSAGKTKVGLLLIILALVVVILGLSWLAISWEDKNDAAMSLPDNSPAQVTPTPTVTPVVTPSIRRTTLTDPTGQDVLGELTKESATTNEHLLKLTLKLSDPGETGFYAVWLTQAEGADKKYLGKLNKSGADYVFEYTSSEAEQNFDKIVITGGTQADQQVENIVAEGTIGIQLLL